MQALRIADFMHARLVDSAKEASCSRSPARPTEIDAFIDLMEPLGLIEVSRAGVVAIARGARGTFEAQLRKRCAALRRRCAEEKERRIEFFSRT